MRRNFGTMSYQWQDRKTKDIVITGFHIIFKDGYSQDIKCGLMDVPTTLIEAHGEVIKAKAIFEEVD